MPTVLAFLSAMGSIRGMRRFYGRQVRCVGQFFGYCEITCEFYEISFMCNITRVSSDLEISGKFMPLEKSGKYQGIL